MIYCNNIELHKRINTLKYISSNFKIRPDVIAYLRRVTIKRMCNIWNHGKTHTFYGYSQRSMQSTADYITSNLEIEQSVAAKETMVSRQNTYQTNWYKRIPCLVVVGSTIWNPSHKQVQ